MPAFGLGVVLPVAPLSGERARLIEPCSFGAFAGAEPHGVAPAGLGGHYALERKVGAKLSRMVWYLDMEAGRARQRRRPPGPDMTS